MARSVERMNAIKERLAAGMSADEIAKDLGIGRSTVYRFK
ncbi:transposase, partial [Sulfitobacter undariae]|nr:transposase [Sulfitobacter undariae]